MSGQQLDREIGARVRKLRLERGLSQQDVSSEEVSPSYISLIEAGKRIPSKTVVELLAARLGCEPDYLLTGRDQSQIHGTRLQVTGGEVLLARGEVEAALESFSLALGQPELLEPEMDLRARLGQAKALERLGRLEAAVAILQRLAEGNHLMPGTPPWFDAMIALVRCLRTAGDYAASIETGERALREVRMLGLDTTDDYIMLAVTVAGAHWTRGDLTSAQCLLNRMLEIAHEQTSPSARGSVYWNASLVARSRGSMDQAVAFAERALDLIGSGDNVRHLGMVKRVYGSLLLETDPPQPRAARTLLTEAMEVLETTGNVFEQAGCEVRLGRAELDLGNAAAARKHAESSLARVGHTAHLHHAEALVLLAETQLESGEHRDAEASLNAATEAARNIAPARDAAEIWRRIGDVWLRADREGEAVKAYQAGLGAAGIPERRKATADS